MWSTCIWINGQFFIVKQLAKKNGIRFCICVLDDRICIESRMFVWIYNGQNCFHIFFSLSEVYITHTVLSIVWCPLSSVSDTLRWFFCAICNVMRVTRSFAMCYAFSISEIYPSLLLQYLCLQHGLATIEYRRVL